MIKTFLTFSYRNHFQETFLSSSIIILEILKNWQTDIIFYLPEGLHPVNKLLLQHTVTFAQDYWDQIQYNLHQLFLLQIRRGLLLVVVLRKWWSQISFDLFHFEWKNQYFLVPQPKSILREAHCFLIIHHFDTESTRIIIENLW